MSETMQVRKENQQTVTEGEAKRLQNEAMDRQEREYKTKREATAEHLAELDNLLDEIDLVLEENPEEFVNSYIQKGGQAILAIPVKSVMALEAHRLIIHGVKVVPANVSPTIIATLATVYALICFAPLFSKKFMRSDVSKFTKSKVSLFLFARVQVAKLAAPIRTIVSALLYPLLNTARQTLLKLIRVFIIPVKIFILHILSTSTPRKVRAAELRSFDFFGTLRAFPHTLIVPQKGGE